VRSLSIVTFALAGCQGDRLRSAGRVGRGGPCRERGGDSLPQLPDGSLAAAIGVTDCDYRYERSEYASHGILEYLVVDPIRNQVVVLTLVDGPYEDKTCAGVDRFALSCLPTLFLNADRILAAGRELWVMRRVGAEMSEEN